MSNTIFFTLFRTKKGEQLAQVVIESLRTFGGSLCDSPIWVFIPQSNFSSEVLPGMGGIERIPLKIEGGVQSYPFVDKVYACVRAEALAGSSFHSLVMLSLDCLILNPPLLFCLNRQSGFSQADIALRPIHHRNIGSLAGEPLDSYWQGIYRTLKFDKSTFTVESFVDKQMLHPYFNTHCFSLNPALGLAQMWWENFKSLITDQAFQDGPCRGELHKIFLHQAVFSTLVAKNLTWERIRLLPSEYNFPLNLLDEIPEGRKPDSLNNLVNAVYEDTFPWGKIKIREPLYSWLEERLSGE